MAPTTPTKTEQLLLDQAHRHPHGVVSVTWGYQAGRRFGRRDIHAANALVRRGVLVKVDSDSTPLYKHRYGINGRVTASTFRLATHVSATR